MRSAMSRAPPQVGTPAERGGWSGPGRLPGPCMAWCHSVDAASQAVGECGWSAARGCLTGVLRIEPGCGQQRLLAAVTLRAAQPAVQAQVLPAAAPARQRPARSRAVSRP